MRADQDEELTCQKCNNPFLFTARDKAFFAGQNPPWTPPKRCKACRDALKAGREQGQGANQGYRPPHNTSQANRPSSGGNGPIVQYRSRVVADNFNRVYGAVPQTAPAQAPPPARAQTNDRRTDAFTERRARKKHRGSWQEQDTDG